MPALSPHLRQGETGPQGDSLQGHHCSGWRPDSRGFLPLRESLRHFVFQSTFPLFWKAFYGQSLVSTENREKLHFTFSYTPGQLGCSVRSRAPSLFKEQFIFLLNKWRYYKGHRWKAGCHIKIN